MYVELNLQRIGFCTFYSHNIIIILHTFNWKKLNDQRHVNIKASHIGLTYVYILMYHFTKV